MSTTSPIQDTNNTNVIDSFRRREALRRAMADIEAVDGQQLTSITVDIPSAMIAVLGCLPEINALREQVSNLIDFDVASFDKLETYALATAQAHTNYLVALEPSEPIQLLNDQLLRLREVLISDIKALATRKLLDATALGELRGAHGYKNLTFDILLCCGILRRNWDAISSRTGVQIAEIEQAESLADRLEKAVGEKEQGPQRATAVNDVRYRAFTLLARTYDQARRAVNYLRWDHNDADTIAPSLYAGRGGRGKPDPVVVEPPVPPVVPTPVVPVPVAPVGVNGGTVRAAAGMPSDEPFDRR